MPAKQVPICMILVGMPRQAELEVHASHALPPHLGLNRLLLDVPPQAADRRGFDDPRFLRRLVPREAAADLFFLPECLAQDLLRLEHRVQVARDQPEGNRAVHVQLLQQRPELLRVHERLRLVRPLPLGQSLGQLVRNDAHEHEVVQAVRQLLAHDLAEVARDLRWATARAEGPNAVVLQVEHWGVLHKHLANAVAIHQVVFHLLSHCGLHEVREGRLLDHVNRGIEVESAAGDRLKLRQVQVGIGEAVLRACEHARIHELVARDGPLLQDGVQVDPLEQGLAEVDVDDHRLDSVEKQAGRPKDRGDDALFLKVGQLRAHEVRGLQALVAFRAKVVEDEVHKVAINATRRDCETLLRLGFLAFR
mmetsp:Transcript_35100/g.101091  ORF Transcript_35100/g.101091 Transcript_35100/m.101091 type:complete len:364 (-) Transcript_35100:433-1524(-)